MKVLIYGAGCPGKMIKEKLTGCEIQAYVDRNVMLQGTFFEGIPVVSPNSIHQYQYDYIIISNRHGMEISQSLINDWRVERSRIIDYTKGLLFDDRVATLRLIVELINNNANKGQVAEVGVYKGEFAQYINILFPNKKLYLIDTFEGFSENDVELEKECRFSNADTGQYAFCDIDAILLRMKYPENCVVKKGQIQYLIGNDNELKNEKYCYVSIDVDLYAPILCALNFFWERMVIGGYIMIHDYNNSDFKGAKQAVNEFCEANGIFLCPIPDTGGTAVLIKTNN